MDLSESKFDKFSGYEGSLFSNTPYVIHSRFVFGRWRQWTSEGAFVDVLGALCFACRAGTSRMTRKRI